MKLLLSTILVLLPGISFAKQYLCVADKATGFVYNKRAKSWQQANFAVKDTKYILSFLKKSAYKYKVTEMGKDFQMATCKDGFSRYGNLICGGGSLGMDFRFNRNSGRYIKTYPGGYHTGGDAKADTPSIEIGKCSPL